jgi:hypothetical protein
VIGSGELPPELVESPVTASNSSIKQVVSGSKSFIIDQLYVIEGVSRRGIRR